MNKKLFIFILILIGIIYVLSLNNLEQYLQKYTDKIIENFDTIFNFLKQQDIKILPWDYNKKEETISLPWDYNKKEEPISLPWDYNKKEEPISLPWDYNKKEETNSLPWDYNKKEIISCNYENFEKTEDIIKTSDNTKSSILWNYGYFEKSNKNKELPEGNWKQTCKVVDYRAPFLWASCEDIHGTLVDTSLDTSKCYKNRIKNVDGTLECN